MHPITFLRSVRFAIVAWFVLPFSVGYAEDKSPASPAYVDPYSISIDFAGGPLSKLLASLDTPNDGRPKLSIIQSAGVDPVLPAFTVRNVRMDAVFTALGQIVELQGFLLHPVAPNLAVLTQIQTTRAPAFAAFQVETKLGDRSIEEFTAAIQAACEFARPDQKASTLRFKYHPGTKLLFVAGTPEEVEIAHRVFGSLPDNPAIKAATAAPDKK